MHFQLLASFLFTYVPNWHICTHQTHPFSHEPCTKASNVPFTVRETSFSAAPTRGTTARHTYFPASSCLTDFSVRMFSLLSTCSQRSKIKTLKRSWPESKRIRTHEWAAKLWKGPSFQLLKSNLGQMRRTVWTSEMVGDSQPREKWDRLVSEGHTFLHFCARIQTYPNLSHYPSACNRIAWNLKKPDVCHRGTALNVPSCPWNKNMSF